MQKKIRDSFSVLFQSRISSLMLGALRQIAAEAASVILGVYQSGVSIEAQAKGDGSPLTEADRLAHQLITERLADNFPQIPILSEEQEEIHEIPWRERQHWQRFFLVDPLDGTKEFLKRNGEFTVNIALIDQGIPVVGVVHVPTSGCEYFAEHGKGAFKQDQGHTRQMVTTGWQQQNPARVVGSRSHGSVELEAFISRLPGASLISRGSSLKLCLVAEGSADIYPRHGPTSLWDTAAGQCVVVEAGGFVVDSEGGDLRYGLSESVRNPPFIVAASERDFLVRLFSSSFSQCN